MIKDLFEKIDYFWFFLLLTVFVCFGYFFTNPTIGIDDELIVFFTSTEIILQVGRLGKFLTNIIFQPQIIPMVYDVLGISFFVISIILICDIFKKYLSGFTKKEMTIFSTLAISFPFAAFVFIFIHNCIDLGLCFLSAALASSFFIKYFYEDKKKIYLLYTFLLLIFSISMYETGLFYFILIPAFVIIYSLIFDKHFKFTNRELYTQVGTSILLLVSVIFIYHIILKIVMYTCGMDYNKIDDYMKYNFSSINTFITSVSDSFCEFGRILYMNINNHLCCKLIIISCITLLLLSLYYTIRKKNLLIMLLAILMTLIPVSYFLATGFPHMQYRIFFAYGIMNAMAFVLIYKLFSQKPYIEKILLFLCFTLVFAQAKEMNAMFFTEHLKYENDKLFAYSIDNDLKRLNLEYYPIVFVGVRESIQPTYSFNGLANEINASIYNWDRCDTKEGELTTQRPYQFMQQIGYAIYPFFELKDKKTEKIIQYQKEIENAISEMQVYPKENSIKKLNDFVLIRIGKSRFDKNYIR